MGTIRKRGLKYYAEVCVDRRRQGKTCRTKAAAEAWIRDQERALRETGAAHTLEDTFARYRRTYTARKPSRVREERRLERLLDVLGGDLLLADLSPDRLTQWRDDGLQRVSAGSLLRDWNLLNHVLAVAVREWEWIPTNPLVKVTRPTKPRPRSRVWHAAEVEAFLVAAGHPGDTLTARVGDCLLLSLETAMRAGEIVGLCAEHIHARHVHLPKTKNGSARDVPLSTRAREILDCYPDGFGITGSQLDSLFRKVRNRAGLEGVRFHDARRTALTRMSRKIGALELARISGHKDLRILLDTYYAPTIDELADKLD